MGLHKVKFLVGKYRIGKGYFKLGIEFKRDDYNGEKECFVTINLIKWQFTIGRQATAVKYDLWYGIFPREGEDEK